MSGTTTLVEAGANSATGPAAEPAAVRGEWLAWCVLAAVLVLVAALRVKFFDIPLDRDEGEFAYGGQLLLTGELPYRDLHAMKMPGIYAAYAAAEGLFGQTRAGVHTGLLVVNLCSIVLAYAWGRQWFGPLGACTVAVTFASYTLCRAIEPMAAQAEHFVLLPALVGLLLLTVGVRRWNAGWLLAAGVAMGTALLMKQHGLGFVVLAGVFTALVAVIERPGWSKAVGGMAALGVGSVLPLAATAGLMWWLGALGEFWFWTITYAREYTAELSWQAGWESLQFNFRRQWIAAGVIWTLAVGGLAAVAWQSGLRRRLGPLALALVVGTVAAVSPGLYFRSHYFLLCVPLLAWSVACAVTTLGAALAGVTPAALGQMLRALLVMLALGWPLIEQTAVAVVLSPVGMSRMIYGASLFPESLPLAKRLAERTLPDDRIGVFGSEPQIFFYAQRRSATPHVYMYPLMEPQPFAARMQEEMIADIERQRPKYLVDVECVTSWLRRPESETKVFEWFEQYVARGYELEGVIEILPTTEGGTTYRTVELWDEEARGHQVTSSVYFRVYRRRGE